MIKLRENENIRCEGCGSTNVKPYPRNTGDIKVETEFPQFEFSILYECLDCKEEDFGDPYLTRIVFRA